MTIVFQAFIYFMLYFILHFAQIFMADVSFFLFFYLNQIKVSCLFPLYNVITDAGFRGREEGGWTEGKNRKKA